MQALKITALLITIFTGLVFIQREFSKNKTNVEKESECNCGE